MRPLVTAIESALLDVFEGSLADRDLDKTCIVLRDGAKHLRSLDLYFPPPTEQPYELWSDNLTFTMSTIPLKYIGLLNVRLPWEHPFDYFLQNCTLWRATLTHLIMPNQPTSLHELELLAGFSALQVLAVNVQVVDVPTSYPPRAQPINGAMLQLQSYFILHELQPKNVYDLAR
ncbi:hypothetical protein FS749_000902 [Ceratobasidium sp. UAMH 11750]|nr:hypothetical protein FS749_000902 [Ceratobasidium sp. UAMH 11750]